MFPFKREGEDPKRMGSFGGAASDWGYRRFILHFATLAEMAGGVLRERGRENGLAAFLDEVTPLPL